MPESRLTPHRAADFVIGLVGTAVLSGPYIDRGSDGNVALRAAIAACGAALSWSISIKTLKWPTIPEEDA